MSLDITPNLLFQVGAENVRNLGPVSDDVARDLGVVPFGELPDTIEAIMADYEPSQQLTEKQDRTVKLIAPYICGDCLITLTNGQSCSHMAIGKNGNRRIIG